MLSKNKCYEIAKEYIDIDQVKNNIIYNLKENNLKIDYPHSLEENNYLIFNFEIYKTSYDGYKQRAITKKYLSDYIYQCVRSISDYYKVT